MPSYTNRIVCGCVAACLLVVSGHFTSPPCQAQTVVSSPSPQPTPPTQQQDPIKIYTEEVLLPVIATDSDGRFDPTLAVDDLLILEDGQPQAVRSVRRIPASVLLLLDTGGFRNPAMKTNATRDLAMRLVSQLRSGDQVAILQFGGKVELIQNWTAEQEVAIRSLKSKLSSGRHTRLIDALSAAATQLKDSPPGNRHIVLVTDGGESSIAETDLAKTTELLFSTQSTVHLVSYTLLGRKAIDEVHPKIPAKIIFEDRKRSPTTGELNRPNEPETVDAKAKSKLRRMLKEQYSTIIDLDFSMWRNNRDYLKVLHENERWLAFLAAESGGSMMLPNSTEQLPKLIDELAREIDSQYLVTYRPKSGVALKSSSEVRRIEVVSRRVGLYVRSRRSYIVTAFSQ